jgi:sulfur carrier protein
MIVFINNVQHEVPENSTINDAIKVLQNIPKAGFAIALNSDVVTSTQYDKTILHDGDKLIVIKAFYGG